MKKIFSVLTAVFILACSNSTKNSPEPEKPITETENPKDEPVPSESNYCDNNLLFKQGVEIAYSSYDGTGKGTKKQVSTVKKVYTDGGMTISEMEMKSTTENGANEKTYTATYKCDGKLLYLDMAGFLSDNKKNMRIETSGFQFPFNISVGETLPDANYSINMNTGGVSRKVSSHVKERKVEAKEDVTTAAGTFSCYKISSVIETDITMPGMDEKSKKIMEEVKKRMGKNKMIFWYAPEVTIIKMEFYMGDKLLTRSEITSIKK